MNSIDLNDLVRGVAELYPTRETGVAVTLDLDRGLPLLAADPGRIRQMLHNLLKNAIEALEGRRNARIHVSTRRLGQDRADKVEIMIEDNGPGFNGDILEHIFEPYVTSKPKGTGLGLAIVKKLAEEHGGVISAENGAAGGACITVLLPITEDARNFQILKAARRHNGHNGNRRQVL
jgi:nitrogen fixation/metabolism regulation signal transduction histidine kinase